MRQVQASMLGKLRSVMRTGRNDVKRLVYGLLGPHHQIPPSSIKHVRILVNTGMGYGNAILFEPVLRKLREVLPHAVIAIEGPRAYAEALKGCGSVDEFVVVEDGALVSLKDRIQAWKAGGVDTIIEAYMPLLNLKQRILIRMAAKYFLFSELAEENRFFRGKHETEEGFLILRSLGIAHDFSDMIPRMSYSEEELARGKAILQARCRTLNGIVGLHLGSNVNHQQFRRWPAHHFAHLCQRIKREYPNVEFAVFGSELERDDLEAFLREFGSAHDCLSVGNFYATGAVIRHCQLFISNDSGVMHLANAVGVPVLALFGPTIIEKSMPINEEGHVLCVSLGLACQPCYWTDHGPDRCPHHNCWNLLTPDFVWNKSEAFIAHWLAA